ncbi:LOW QUALITY PROTEIN: cytochrome P450 [Colletotrichum acutatum]|uniref:Cytochrome P450 n=1 Tax=Glomerella acutata TaxID=27357 RepID=A0AAD8UR78_GLOAC|nr:LOW QUALITY PROTEIN: cytochrome P450 [Colletotrichum acutatum]KAK1726379.1 LOW QUALITY PROTEIN: cytochrome P450 [Colletotrichum acutatum]
MGILVNDTILRLFLGNLFTCTIPLGLLFLYFISLGTYNITFHPLAKFPAFTGWHETYHELFGAPGKTFGNKIQKMHEDYGPIVRINPHELHVSDHGFFDVLFAGGSARRDKYPPSASVQGAPGGIFGTLNHDAHRMRRSAISGFFSKQSVVVHEGLIHEKPCEVFKTYATEGNPFDIHVPLLAYAIESYCAHALGETDQAKWRKSIIGLLHFNPIVRQFPWFLSFAFELLMWLIRPVSSDLALVTRVLLSLNNFNRSKTLVGHGRPSQRGHQVSEDNGSLMQAILTSNLPQGEKGFKRMAQESFTVLTASGDTIGRTPTTAVYHLLSDPNQLAKLKEELRAVMPDSSMDVPLRKLESLPWITAVIKESLRISTLVTMKVVLQAPTECLAYQDWVIPTNTPIGMTFADLMMDPEAFPDPRRFDPERWLESHPLYAQNTKCFFPFGRGHRNCIGLNLARAEMYVALAKIMSRIDMELYDVIRERDVDHYRDCFLGEPRDDTKGVRVKILRLLD